MFWGKEDQTVNRLEITWLHQIIPDGQLIQVNQAGHIPHIKQPEMVLTKMIKFIKKFGWYPDITNNFLSFSAVA